jgi:UDP-N-acetylmuramate--alanine ligase
MLFKKTQHIHFVGIGGIGMSGLAEVLLNLGFQISGSDLVDTDITQRLQQLGVRFFLGHRPENISQANVVVVSSAIREDNVEVITAKEQMIPVIPRAEMLAELMRMKDSIAVTGSHGKTTTTSLIGAVLAQAGLDPTLVIGGKLNSWGSNAKLGQGDFLVAEADESDGSFLKLFPTIAVVTTLEEEHLDHYQDLARLKQVFVQFINKVPFYGFIVLCLDEINICGLIPSLEKRYVTYGLRGDAHYIARDASFKYSKAEFVAYYRDKKLGPIKLNMPGIHNVYNALAAVAVGSELKIEFSIIQEALASFTGIERRFEIKGEKKGILWVDDYGHHPTEIQATLMAAKQGWPDKRLVVVFQPHRYTRTQTLLPRFFSAFDESDVLIITAIYSAGERPIEGIDARLIFQGIKGRGHDQAIYLETKEELLQYLLGIIREGDMILTLGAGDIWKIGEELWQQLT